MSRQEIAGLITTANIVISLHRSEGFGLVLAEAMRLGKPIIATASSGNTDFMNEHNSAPVSCRLVPASDSEATYNFSDLLWAERDRSPYNGIGHIEMEFPSVLRKPQNWCHGQKHCQNGKRGNLTDGLSIEGECQLVTLFASVPLTDEAWQTLSEGELAAVAGGQIVARQLKLKSPILREQRT